jgi:hypothetical protein
MPRRAIALQKSRAIEQDRKWRAQSAAPGSDRSHATPPDGLGVSAGAVDHDTRTREKRRDDTSQRSIAAVRRHDRPPASTIRPRFRRSMCEAASVIDRKEMIATALCAASHSHLLDGVAYIDELAAGVGLSGRFRILTSPGSRHL